VNERENMERKSRGRGVCGSARGMREINKGERKKKKRGEEKEFTFLKKFQLVTCEISHVTNGFYKKIYILKIKLYIFRL
jgi:hypothetical protein